jgi:hypothetical protein
MAVCASAEDRIAALEGRMLKTPWWGSWKGVACRDRRGVADGLAANGAAKISELGSDGASNRCDAPTHDFADAQGG